jgi:hypothetical protein
VADTDLRTRLNRRFADLEKERASFIDHYRDLQSFIVPRRGRFLGDMDRNDGSKKHNKLLDNSPTLAARALASGMMAGLTSPARPWFKLDTPDPEMKNFGPVKEWLHVVELRLREIFARSNLYNTLHTIYKEVGVFGTAPALFASSFSEVVRGYPITVGSYVLGLGANLSVDTLYRDVPMTAKMVAEKFGLDRVSLSVKNAIENNNYNQPVTVRHCIEPNMDELGYDGPEARFMVDKPWRSLYWEKNGDMDKSALLEVRGYTNQPFMAPRWDVNGTDTYGSSPGMEALGDAIQLQTMQRWKGEGIHKQVRPPMIAPTALRNAHKTTVPGGVTYYDGQAGMRGFEPAFQVNFQLQYLLEDIKETKDRISRAFYEDLFLMLARSDRREITAREIEERHEEKLIMLGPVLERLEDELLDPLIDRVFQVALDAELIPPPPEELSETELKVEYISILAQAQKAVAINAMERTSTFLGGLVQVQAAGGSAPSILDKFDFDAALEEYGSSIGISPLILRDQKEVEEKRAADAEQAQQAQQMAMMEQMAGMAKDVGGIKTGDETLAGNVIEQVTGANPQ